MKTKQVVEKSRIARGNNASMLRSVGVSIAFVAILALAACNAIGSIINPVIGTWETTVLGVTVGVVYNADGSCSESNTLGELGVTRTGTWTSDSATIYTTWTGSDEESYSYSFNSNKTEMSLALIPSGLSLTYTRQ